MGKAGDMRDVAAFCEEHYAPRPLSNSQRAMEFRRLRQQGKTVVLFSPLLQEGDGLAYRNVLEQYISSFRPEDSIVLLVEVEGMDKPELFEPLQGRSRENTPMVAFIESHDENTVSVDLVQNADWFITTKNYRSLLYLDYGMDYGVKRLYGLSGDVFGKIGR